MRAKEIFNFHIRDTMYQLFRMLYVITRNLFYQCFTLQWFSPPPNHYVISFNKTTSQTTYTQSSNHPRQAKRPVSCCNIHPSEHVERFTWFSPPPPKTFSSASSEHPCQGLSLGHLHENRVSQIWPLPAEGVVNTISKMIGRSSPVVWIANPSRTQRTA